MYRIAQKRVGNYTLTATAYDADGASAAITTPVSVTIYRNGAEVATGTPTINSGVLSYDVAVTLLTELGIYDAIWAGTAGGEAWQWETDFELVSGFYFTIAELRASQRELENENLYPDAILEAKRDEAEADFEEIANRAFLPRAQTVTLRGGNEILLLPHHDPRSVVSVVSGGTELDLTGVEVDPLIGGLRHPGVWPSGLLTVSYTYGLDAPNAAVKRAVMMLAKEYAIPSSIPSRATVMTNEVGSYRISVADKTGKTGLPDVDAAAARYGCHVPVGG